ncbi:MULTISPECIES: hypothetical protein [unclassified Sphingobacterium]|uniref:hypothetical protein n=1 Tax=unclassified Sphingobacterium TaxID=2609468 RepID=UPI001049C9BC|nr:MULTISPECIES: hypothetical protein [unclassified Sphingobacterium]MCS3554377.1 hypothetical protein [Sphingobacterium sp. JUb21]TCR08210.1 hypothetical protein EDF66_104315 [Sphingobacterium sp. JUb20]
MTKTSSYADSLAAADKQAGFDYQFYIFLLKCLEIKTGQVIGYEEKDDVHIDFNNQTTFIQVKHTIGSVKGGGRPNLTQKDTDLWKTVANWINIINDPASQRSLEADQIKFIDKSEFILISNKSISDTNTFIDMVTKFKSTQKTIADVRVVLGKMITKTNPTDYSEVDKYILAFSAQSDAWLSTFLKKLCFTLEINNIIIYLKDQIKERYMIQSDAQSDDVFNCLFSNLKTEIYNHVSEGNRSISFKYEDIKDFTSACLYRINKPLVRTYETLDLPDNLEDQNFIKQLIDIGDVQQGDTETIIEYTKFKVLMAQNMKDWEQNHELLPTSKTAFIDNCILKWKNIHTKHHRPAFNSTLTEEKLRQAGLNCLDEIRLIELSVSDVSLDSMLSNGQFYSLSDELKIGWAHDWKTSYL